MKMLKGFIFVATIFAFSFHFPAQDLNIARQTRIHQLISLNNGMQFEYTWINHFQKENDTMKYSKLYVLLDLDQYGQWIYKKELRNLSSDSYEISKTFENLETRELLIISYTSTSTEDPYQERYILHLQPTDKKFVVDSKSLNKKPNEFPTFVLNNFSKNFVEGLGKLKELVFKTFGEGITFQITPYDLIPIWGKTPESERSISSSKEKFPIILNPNCDFDAKFGYPCQPEEVPSKNPKVLVIEKKQ